MKLKERVIKIGKWIAGVISALIVLIAIIFGLAQTDMCKRQLAVWLASGLSRGPDAQVKLGKIDGLIPFNIRLDRLDFKEIFIIALPHVKIGDISRFLKFTVFPGSG